MTSDRFGRQGITRHGLQTVQRVSKGGRVGGSDETSLPDRLRGILIGLGIIGLMVAVYVTTMKGFGSALDKHRSENLGYPVEDVHRDRSSQPPATR
jgi:hypothetical protein